ncbi:MAG: caspase family protein, partial [Pseudomonadota bacterium]|nr:caspase family protein [Pseudomonadota bacterium]
MCAAVRSAISFLAIVFFLSCSSAPASAKRVALVIGNSAYKSAPALKNPKNDAAAVSTVLEKLGFQVIAGLDLDRPGMEAKAREFALASRGAEVSLFYFAGHG